MNRTRLRLKKQTLCLDYLPVRALAFSVALLSIADLARSEAAEPQSRPALIGNGLDALVNVINTKRLVEKGQRDGLLMFKCNVSRFGKVEDYIVYRETPGSKVLKEEVGNALWRSSFIPAIYNGKPTGVLFLGTVLFVVADGKPHLRIYANQDRDDIAKGNNFIAPQLIAGTANKVPLKDELAKARIYHQQGVVELETTVDANGNQKHIKVLSEDPPGFNFGKAELELLWDAKYIPGFRNGRPVDCTFDQYHWFWLVYKR